jgi:beta-N-acetylhexosaminidase
MVNLKAKPFYLSDEQVKWVKDTYDSLSLEERIGQLFINFFKLDEAHDLPSFLNKYPIGGARYHGGQSSQIRDFLETLQKYSKVPLLIAANCDQGGNGAMLDGTYVASAAHVEATQSEAVAYDAGYVSGKESQAIGVNWNFGPNVDILTNWRNTIVNTRAYGTNAADVLKYSKAFMKGLKDTGLAACAKHFPGDGTEERDQHLILGVNELSVKEWELSFGEVYRGIIDEGVDSIMVGHIALPEYQFFLNPNLKYEDILPASLSKELLTDLLRNRLGFNGVVLTDASHMIGMAASMRREDYVPLAIAAGCDMFLFFNDHEEDFEFMLNGYKKGVITASRLEDAVYRILALKASLDLPNKQTLGTLVPEVSGLSVIGSSEHLEKTKRAADLGITLVKNNWQQLPIKPTTHKRIRLHYLSGEINGLTHGNLKFKDDFVESLTKAGFEVTVHDGNAREKGKTKELSQHFDAAIVVANVVGYAAENVYRIRWKMPMSTDIPWYIYELPTVFVSLNYTTHLYDVPMVKTFINAYGSSRVVIDEVVQKIMGKSEFKGKYNEHVWCGNLWEAKR